jgi:hypothetical protein
MTNRMNGRAQRGACTRICHVGQAIVHPETVSPSTHQAGTAQLGKVTGDRGLRNSKGCVNIADDDFAVGQHA